MKNKILLGSTLLLLSAGVNAATICVHPTGAGGCESSIADGITAASANDTVAVRRGVYNENVTINKTLTLRGPLTGRAIIDAGILLTGDAITVGANDVVIARMFIQNGAADGITINTGVTGLTVKKSTFIGINDDAIHSSGLGNHDMVFNRNTFKGIGTSAINVEGDDIAVAFNKIGKNEGDAVSIIGDLAFVINNKFTDIDGAAIDIEGDLAFVFGNKLTSSGDIDVVGVDALVLSNKLLAAGNIIVEGSIAIVALNKLSASGEINVFGGSNPLILFNRIRSKGGINVECLGTCNEAIIAKNSIVNGKGLFTDSDAPGMLVFSNKLSHVEGMESAGISALIIENKVRNASLNCLTIQDSAHFVTLNKLLNCGKNGIFLSEIAGAGVIDNKVINVAGNGIVIDDLSVNNLITNNTVKKVSKFGLMAFLGSDGNVIADNIFSNIVRNDICSAFETAVTANDLTNASTDQFVIASNIDCPSN